MNSLAAFLAGPLVERLGWALLHFVWEGGTIAATLAVALRGLRHRSAAVRYRAGWIALAAMACAVPLTAWLAAASPAPSAAAPATTIEQPAAENAGRPGQVRFVEKRPIRTASLPGTTAGADQSAAEGRPAETIALPARLSAQLRSALPWVVGSWLIGAMLTALWHLGGWWQLRRLRRVGVREAPEEARRLLAGLLQRFALSRAVKMVVSVEVAVPTLLGWLRPLVILPAAVLAELPPRQLEMILAHELAHLRRCDYLWNLAQTAIETMLFYHPAVWWVSRQIRAEREMCCDQEAVAVLGDRFGYARALAALAELCRRPATLTAGLALGAGGGSFSTRIRRLLGQPARDRVALPAWLGGGLAVLLLLAAGVAGVTWAGDKAVQRPAEGQSSAVAAIARGEAFLEDGDLDQALAAFTEVVRLSPQDAKAYYSRACVYQRKDEIDKFSADLAQAIRLDPRGTRAYFDRGWAYGRTREIDQAIARLTERIRLPNACGAYSARGWFSMYKGDLDKAITDLTEAIRLRPGGAFDYDNRGCAYGEKGDFDKAIADGTEAIRLEPGQASPYCSRGWAYAAKGDLDKALADAAKAVRLYRGLAAAYYVRGYVYARKGQRDKAAGDYATAIRLEGGQNYDADLESLAVFRRGGETESCNWPAYRDLCDSAFRKELRVTPEQEKQLREVLANWLAENAKWLGGISPEPSEKAEAEYARVWPRVQEARIAGRKQIEKILTSRQLEAYKQHALGERIYQWLTMGPDGHQTVGVTPEHLSQLWLTMDPGGIRIVGVTPEQLAKLRRLAAEITRQSREQSRQVYEELAAVLNAWQREKLRGELERAYSGRYPAEWGDSPFCFSRVYEAPVELFFRGGTLQGTVTPGAPADAADAILYLPVYEWLGAPAVRKELGLSAAQQKQLVEIKKKYDAGQHKQARTGGDFQSVEKDAVERIEALLTPQQLAAFKEITFRQMVSAVLGELFVQEKIGLGRRQQAAVKDIFRAAAERTARAEREACEQVLAILTPQQRETLREALSREAL
jgi:tetratricopeptide (TPR) repeat protein